MSKYHVLLDGTPIVWDFARTSDLAVLTLAGNRTISIVNVPEGAIGAIMFDPDGHTLTLPAGSDGDTPPTVAGKYWLSFIKGYDDKLTFNVKEA